MGCCSYSQGHTDDPDTVTVSIMTKKSFSSYLVVVLLKSKLQHVQGSKRHLATPSAKSRVKKVFDV